MPKQEKSLNISVVNKQILELKKKIQLSEGQRKALFEVCENDRKANSDEIVGLKKEISQLVVQLSECNNATAKLKVQHKNLEAIIGPFKDKKPEEIEHLLDLQIIDRNKQLDLIGYKIRQRQKYLAKLGTEYQILLSEEAKRQISQKIDKPIKRSTSELQNNIHAVEVQLREATHIRTRYRDIRKSLQEDGAKFESNIKKIEEELQTQKADIEKLHQVMKEATRLRSKARSQLVKEERAAMSSAKLRESQTAEGKRLINTRKIELELLEKRIFQRGKLIRPQPEGAEEVNDEEKSETPPPKEADNKISDIFEILKKTTGETSAEGVLNSFKAQKDTQARLLLLRKNSENEKAKGEKRLEELNCQLEHYKYMTAKETEKKSAEMEQLQTLIDEQKERYQLFMEKRAVKDKLLSSILENLQSLNISLNPLTIPQKDPLKTLMQVEEELSKILEKIEDTEENAEEEVVFDDKWLPAPYSGLVRRTPLSQTGTSPANPSPGSEDEEEVPSRSYLKRQAQMVIEAKSRRKNVRGGKLK